MDYVSDLDFLCIFTLHVVLVFVPGANILVSTFTITVIAIGKCYLIT